MGLSPAQEDVLDSICRRIPSRGTWCIFGSTDSVLRGLDDDPSDIDILATEDAAEQFREQFADEFVATREVGRSQIDEYEVDGEEIEVIFDRVEKDYQSPLLELENVELETSNDRGVPMLPVSLLVQSYRKIDKHDTADRLESRFG